MPINKEALYPTYNRSVERKQAIHEQAIRKSLDLPVDDDVNITTTNNGVSGKALAGILVAMVVSGGGGALVVNQMGQPVPQPPPFVRPVVEGQAATLKFYNSAGEEIILPQRKPGAQE